LYAAVIKNAIDFMTKNSPPSAGDIISAIMEAVGILVMDLITLLELIGEVFGYVMPAFNAMFGTDDATVAGGLQRNFSNFAGDVSEHQNPYMPFLTFIEPKQDPFIVGGEQNSGHPGNSDALKNSEQLIFNIYNSISQSAMWKRRECALLLLYDEHGGLYDPVPPPPPNPALNPNDPQNSWRTAWDSHADLGEFNLPFGDAYHKTFDFSLLGVRVPSIFISPFTIKGVKHGAPPTSDMILEHSSVIRTLQRRLGDTGFLTNRVAHTNDFFDLLGNLPLEDGDPLLAKPPQIIPPKDSEEAKQKRSTAKKSHARNAN